MKLSEWCEQNFTHVTFDEYIGNLKVPKVNVELTYGLLSTEDKKEFQKLVFHLAPTGVIVDTIFNNAGKQCSPPSISIPSPKVFTSFSVMIPVTMAR